MELLELNLYSYWACALINGDVSGLEQGDIDELQEFTDMMTNKYGQCWCLDVSDETWFGVPDYGSYLQGDIAAFTFDITSQ